MEPAATPSSFPASDPGSAWIENDGLLRDEGVIFGRAVGIAPLEGEGGPLHWKLEAIRSHYRQQAASEQVALEAADEALAALDEPFEQAEALVAEKTEALEHALDADAPLRVRDGAGFLVALLACAGAPLVVSSVLRPDAFAHPVLVSIAVSVAGLFSLFQARSLLFVSHAHLRRDESQPEVWKVYVAEMLLPLAAAGFVAVFAHRAGAWGATAITFAFVLSLFWITGRLALSTLPRLAEAFAAARTRTRHAREADAARETRDDLRQRRDALRHEQQKHRTEVARYAHLADARVALFLSEFELARRFARLREEKLRERRAEEAREAERIDREAEARDRQAAQAAEPPVHAQSTEATGVSITPTLALALDASAEPATLPSA